MAADPKDNIYIWDKSLVAGNRSVILPEIKGNPYFSDIYFAKVVLPIPDGPTNIILLLMV